MCGIIEKHTMNDAAERTKHLILKMKESGLGLAEAEAAIGVRDKIAGPFKLLSQYDNKSITPPPPVSMSGDGSITADELIMVNEEEQRRNGRDIYILTPERAGNLVGFVKSEFSEQGGFGVEQGQGVTLESIIKSIYEGSLYPTPLAKAARLFYLIVKKRPFVNGNKKIAIFLFSMFLEMYSPGIVKRKIGTAISSVALFIAASDSEDEEQTVNFLMRLFGPQE